MTLLRTAVLAGATLTTGLMAGLFFAYSCSVMPGLAATDDRTFVGTMQWINRRILNGWFLAAFLGAVLLLALAVALHLTAGGRVLAWTGAALVLYLVTLVITMRCSVPLNDRLDAAGPVDRITDLTAVRERFEATWVRWNLARTVTNVAAFACLIGALLTRRA
ncbi:anthrone oxygenase family protein [Micromonospora sp. 4G57]|uniref:Anthrone oxygenase family protein n=1 Tax=Micromonospora sicca TaxID=2202420 RepID=A0ABU5JLR5_9ACTN|nr:MULTISPECIES: anthrone oxygenase family protein [unclassified Micromonospora]MDZ5446830.1 anthrone oxygenase family protein [Micromonospora sp. 4G57]MDZ5493565.1 anthrone oxygenase family protein [Micromonospora sp. 4G53]